MSWQTFPISAAPKLSLKSQISCTSRHAEHLELFYITEDGAIMDCNWSSQSPWTGYPIAPPGSAAVGAAITSLTRIDSHLEVFWIGPKGSVEAAFWYAGSPWQRYQLAQPNSADLDSQLASISLFDKKMEVWWTKDGGIRGAFWRDSNQGWTLYDLGNATPVPAGGSLVFSANRTRPSHYYTGEPFNPHLVWYSPDKLSRAANQDVQFLFWVTDAGTIEYALWYPERDWTCGRALEADPNEMRRPYKARNALCAIPQADHPRGFGAHLFYITRGGEVWQLSVQHDGDGPLRLGEPVPVQRHATANREGGITAVVRQRDMAEVYWTSNTQTIQGTEYTEGLRQSTVPTSMVMDRSQAFKLLADGERGRIVLEYSANDSVNGSSMIACVSRKDNKVELFAISPQGLLLAGHVGSTVRDTGSVTQFFDKYTSVKGNARAVMKDAEDGVTDVIRNPGAAAQIIVRDTKAVMKAAEDGVTGVIRNPRAAAQIVVRDTKAVITDCVRSTEQITQAIFSKFSFSM